MIIKLRQKSQVTIPSKCIKVLSIKPGDKFEVTIKDGSIVFTPISVYPKKYIQTLDAEVVELKQKISSGKKNTFKNIDEMIKKLDEK